MKRHKILALIITGVLVLPFFTFASSSLKDQIIDLSDQVNDKKDKLKTLENDLKYYKRQIDETRKKSLTLKNQIELINNHVKKTELEIEEVEMEIDEIELEITTLNSSIKDAQSQITLQKGMVSYYLREIQKSGQKSFLEIILVQPSFSNFFKELRALENLQDNLNGSIEKLQKMEKELSEKQASLKSKKESGLKLKSDLEDKKAKLEAQKTAKTFLIGQSFASESKFQALLAEAQQERTELDTDINKMESDIREKLKNNDAFSYGGSVVLSWPVPKNKITAYFYDPDYPYRYLFEHPAIDIRAAQGTLIKAPAPGYVLKVLNQDSWRKINYIVLVHAGGISTVYLHLSNVYVKPDTYVARGDVIGKTGGTPRTRGAGYFTTGAHLHFEVRKNGAPVDPTEYLLDI